MLPGGFFRSPPADGSLDSSFERCIAFDGVDDVDSVDMWDGEIKFALNSNSLKKYPCPYCLIECHSEPGYYVHKKSCQKRQAHFEQQQRVEVCQYCTKEVGDYQGHKASCGARAEFFARQASETGKWMYALWLVPDPESPAGERASAAIATLAERQNMPSFPAHVTLVAGIFAASEEDERAVVAAAEKLAASFAPFDVSFDGVDRGALWFQSVYLKVRSTEDLQSMRSAACELLSADLEERFSAPATEYLPHLSLLYGDLAAVEQDAILEEIQSSSIRDLSDPSSECSAFTARAVVVNKCRLVDVPLGTDAAARTIATFSKSFTDVAVFPLSTP